jgi:hypothetical protein
MIAISATITFSARLLSHELALGELLAFVGSIRAFDSAETYLADDWRQASHCEQWLAMPVTSLGSLPDYSALIRSSAPLGQSWPYLSRYFFWANVRNALRSGV